MKAVLDIHYERTRSIAACVIFNNWDDSRPAELVRAVMPAAHKYIAGRFYERELPGLLAVLQKASRSFDTLIIDGYVNLKPEAGKGLGSHLFESLSYSPVVIGVAKSSLAIAEQYIPVLRGRSEKPLFVSAIGCSLERAAYLIQKMHGQYRIPTILRLADHQAREGLIEDI